MKDGFLIQIINSVISGVLLVTLPLLMQDRNINIIEIGFIFAAIPIAFQITRLFLGILSDYFGRKIFFVLNGIVALISNTVYYFVYTPIGFLFGKVIEGVKDGSLWAVNRAYVMDHSKEKRKQLIHLRTFSSVAEAAGSLLAGFLIVWFLYSNTILFCLFLGILIIPISLSIKDIPKKKFTFEKAFHFLDFRNKNKKFKKFLLLFFVYGISDGFIGSYIFPLFLRQSGFDIETIGIILGLKLLISGVSLYFFISKNLKDIIILGSILYSSLLLLMGILNPQLAGILLIIFGIATGIGGYSQEFLFPLVMKQECVAGDIGLLMTSFHTARTASLIASGLLISAYGFSSVFLISAIAFMFYGILTYRALKR
jgi:MFS family permease